MRAGADPEGGESVMLTGGSGVLGPDAEWIAGPVYNEETIIYADLDLDHAAREQYAMDIVGHYNRPDIFSLNVDVRRRPHISWSGDARDEPAGDAERESAHG
jgi:nitrilase